MAELQIVPYGCPAPFREALAAAACASGVGALVDPDDLDADGRSVSIVYCDAPERWALVGSLSASGRVVVATITQLSIGEYARGLAAGAASVFHHDTSSAIMIAVIVGAARGEATLPVFAAQSLAAAWVGEAIPATLNDYELGLLTALSAGSRLADLAESVAYSERTVRRQLQSVYLKLGASNRADAIRIASRARLI